MVTAIPIPSTARQFSKLAADAVSELVDLLTQPRLAGHGVDRRECVGRTRSMLRRLVVIRATNTVSIGVLISIAMVNIDMALINLALLIVYDR